MCLRLRLLGVIPRIALKDRVVYKFLRFEKGRFLSPYMDSEYMAGWTYESACKPVWSPSGPMGAIVIEKGIHALSRIEDVRLVINYCQSEGYHYAIATCIIPRGTRYWRGRWSGFASVATGKLRVLKIEPYKVLRGRGSPKTKWV